MPCRRNTSIFCDDAVRLLTNGPSRGEFGVEDSADAERAALRLLQRICRRAEIQRRGDGLVSQRQQGRSGFRQRKSAGGPVEKLQAGVLFQALELQADGRLGEVQQRRGPRHASLARDHDEATQRLGTWEVGHLKILYHLSNNSLDRDCAFKSQFSAN
jgi:hypothetical protein